MNKVAPIVLMLLVVVAAFQVWGTRGGGRVDADGTVSEADLVEETTTTLGRRTFVDLAPLPDNSVVSTRSRSTAAGPRISTSVRARPTTTTRNDDPGDGDRPTTGSTQSPTTAKTTTEPSTPSTSATSEVTPPTTGGGTEPTAGSSTTRRPTTTERPPTTPRPSTTRPPTSQTATTTADDAAPGPGEVAINR